MTYYEMEIKFPQHEFDLNDFINPKVKRDYSELYNFILSNGLPDFYRIYNTDLFNPEYMCHLHFKNGQIYDISNIASEIQIFGDFTRSEMNTMTIEEYRKQQSILNDTRNNHLKDIVSKLKTISDELKILGVKDCGNSINNILTKIHNVLNEEAEEVVRSITKNHEVRR